MGALRPGSETQPPQSPLTAPLAQATLQRLGFFHALGAASRINRGYLVAGFIETGGIRAARSLPLIRSGLSIAALFLFALSAQSRFVGRRDRSRTVRKASIVVWAA